MLCMSSVHASCWCKQWRYRETEKLYYSDVCTTTCTRTRPRICVEGVSLQSPPSQSLQQIMQGISWPQETKSLASANHAGPCNPCRRWHRYTSCTWCTLDFEVNSLFEGIPSSAHRRAVRVSVSANQTEPGTWLADKLPSLQRMCCTTLSMPRCASWRCLATCAIHTDNTSTSRQILLIWSNTLRFSRRYGQSRLRISIWRWTQVWTDGDSNDDAHKPAALILNCAEILSENCASRKANRIYIIYV